MQPFETLEAIAAPYYFPDVDTDKLIPHRFLRKPLAAGYRNFLFYNERFAPSGEVKPDFVLHRSPYDQARILVSGPNFGCGSTREGAVYALAEDVVKALSQTVEKHPGTTLKIDLREQTVRAPDGKLHRFEIDPVRKDQLLRGLDDIGITLQEQRLIESFEANYRSQLPWLGRRQA